MYSNHVNATLEVLDHDTEIEIDYVLSSIQNINNILEFPDLGHVKHHV